MKITDFNVAVVDNDSHLSKWIKEQGRLDVADGFCRFFKEYIPEGSLVLDIGACLGDHTASYSKMVGPNGRVVAFEPNPVAYECLEYNMQAYPNVQVMRVGLGDRPCAGKMKLSENLGASQLLEHDYSHEPGVGIVVTKLDKLSRLHDWNPSFIKMDAEGWEPRIIQGGLAVLERCKPVLLIEINRPILQELGASPEDVYSPLRKLGYTFKPAEPHLSLEMPQIDVLCLPPGRR